MALADMRSRHQFDKGRTRVRQILLCDWDPIEINASGPADEYDVYADRVHMMLLDKRAAASDIAAYLIDIAIRKMELPAGQQLAEKSDRAAKLLIDLRSEFDAY